MRQSARRGAFYGPAVGCSSSGAPGAADWPRSWREPHQRAFDPAPAIQAGGFNAVRTLAERKGSSSSKAWVAALVDRTWHSWQDAENASDMAELRLLDQGDLSGPRHSSDGGWPVQPPFGKMTPEIAGTASRSRPVGRQGFAFNPRDHGCPLFGTTLCAYFVG
jgi:hypothetical protein